MRRFRQAVAFLLLFAPVLLLGQRGASGSRDTSSSGSPPVHATGSGSDSRSNSSNNSDGVSRQSSHDSSNVSGSTHSSIESRSSRHDDGREWRSSSGDTPAHHNSAVRSNVSNEHTASEGHSAHSFLYGDSTNPRSSLEQRGTPEPREAWTNDPPRVRFGGELPPMRAADLNHALQAGRLDSTLKNVGLEPNEKAYRARLSEIFSAETSQVIKKPGWFGRVFLGRESRNAATEFVPRNPFPSKPCLLKSCTAQPPSKEVCSSGFRDSGGKCRPWGYLRYCDDDGYCYVQLAGVNGSYCDAILRQMLKLQRSLGALEKSKESACGSGGQAGCSLAGQEEEDAEYKIRELQNQYGMCKLAAQQSGFN